MRIRLWVVGILFINLLLCTCFSTYAQVIAPGYSYRNWTVENGLPVNYINEVEQTEDGYIWFSSRDGLVRFDGNRFQVFNKGNTPGLISNRFRSIHGNGTNELWIITDTVNETDYIIHYKNSTFTSYGPDNGLVGASSSLRLDEEGALWFINQNRILNIKDGIVHEPFSDLVKGDIVDMSPGLGDDFWVSTDQGVCKIAGGTVHCYTRKDGLFENTGRDIFVDSIGRVWLITPFGVNIIDNGVVSRIDGVETFLQRRIYEDESYPGRIILPVKGPNSMVYLNGETQMIPSTLLKDNSTLRMYNLIGGEGPGTSKEWLRINNKVFHKGNVVFEISGQTGRVFDDEQGGIWVVDKNTLYRISETQFDSFSRVNGGVSNVYPLFQDHEGVVWTAHLAGRVSKYDWNNWQRVNTGPTTRIFSIYEDNEDHIWIGHTNGIRRWDRKEGTGFVDIETPYQNDFKQIRAIEGDGDGNLWVGYRNGIQKKDKQNEWTLFDRTKDGKEVKGVRLIRVSDDGTIWFGTNGSGLFYIKDDELHYFEANDRLSDSIIRSMHEDDDGVLWIGMEGGGLDRIEFQNSEIKITNYGLPEGLFDTVIHSILEDDLGRLWMSSNKGIFWVTKSELNRFAEGKINRIQSTFYNKEDGLPGREGNGGMQNTGIEVSKNEFWFPMVDGIARINPNKLRVNRIEYEPVIEAIHTNDSLVTHPKNGLRVPKELRNLQIEYTAFNYNVKPENIIFRHRLSGYDQNGWTFAGNRREVFFTDVAAGDYTFTVQASVDGSDWEEAEATLSFSIVPYFYETSWFLSLMILSGLGCIYLGFRWRIRQLYNRQKKLEYIVEERTEDLKFEKKQVEKQKEVIEELVYAKDQFFTNISHELRTPLTLVLGPIEQLALDRVESKEEEKSQLNVAYRNGQRLKELVEQVLDLARLDSNKIQLRLSKADITLWTKMIVESFESLASTQSVSLRVSVPDHPILIGVDIDKYQKIMVNLISNAIKFTPEKGSVEVDLTEQEEEVFISVRDTGKGIDHRNLPHVFDRFHSNNERIAGGGHGLGVGLNLTKEFIDIHQGSITVESEPEKGSVFAFMLPKRKEDLSSLGETVEYMSIENGTEATSNDTELQLQKTAKEAPLVLIVEDNPDMRTYISALIKRQGYNVIEARTGLEGKKQLSLSKPDLIISDVMMPDMDGFEFAEFVRSVPELRFTPIVMLTALTGFEDRIKAFDIGVSDYLTKPFHEEELKARVQNLFRLKEERATLEPGQDDTDLSENALFIKRLQNHVKENLSKSNYGVEELSANVAVSRSTLFNKVKSTTGYSPAEFIREIRLTESRYLLEAKKRQTISEIAYDVGFSDPAYFTRLFKKRFGVHPKSFLK